MVEEMLMVEEMWWWWIWWWWWRRCGDGGMRTRWKNWKVGDIHRQLKGMSAQTEIQLWLGLSSRLMEWGLDVAGMGKSIRCIYKQTERNGKELRKQWGRKDFSVQGCPLVLDTSRLGKPPESESPWEHRLWKPIRIYWLPFPCKALCWALATQR